jgi:putative ABC transport system permease protein
MKWTDPLNEYLNWQEDSVGLGSRVVGVVKDYHFLSLEQNIEPLFLSMNKKNIGYLVTMLVKLAPGDLPGSLEKIHSIWKEISPDKPFDYTFLDQDVAKQYESYQRWMSIMGLATGFAILISCLGLFGLAGINAVNRTKEIGIRKVMGAELSNIFILLNRQYIGLSMLAFALAAPVSWFIMNKWLSDFKFKITVGWELFALSMAAGLLVALITVSYHAIKAALVNPAETLKYE